MIFNLKDLELNNYVSWVYSILAGYEANGQLGSPKIVEVANEDINNYITAGVYCFAVAYSPLNKPAGNTNGWLIVIPWQASGGTCKQIWLRHGTPADTDHSIYIRTRINGNWGEWYEVITSKSQGAYQLTIPPVQILSGANLDNYKEVGNYFCTGTSVATTITNSPTVYNFKLVVEQITTAFIQQTILDRMGHRWTRCYTISTGEWSDWVCGSLSNITKITLNDNGQLVVTRLDGLQAVFSAENIVG